MRIDRIFRYGQIILIPMVGMIMIWLGNRMGCWWLTSVVGLSQGLMLRGKLRVTAGATVTAVGGWGLDLVWQSLHTDIGGAAALVATISGIGSEAGWVVIGAACLFAMLLALAGAYVGVAVRTASSLVVSPRQLSLARYVRGVVEFATTRITYLRQTGQAAWGRLLAVVALCILPRSHS